MKIHETVMNGNCMYDSICKILKSKGVCINITTLKKYVINSILKNDEILLNWFMLAKDTQHKPLPEIRHMIPIIRMNINPLSSKSKLILQNEMMKNSYWGDEITLQILEKILNIQFHIFDGNMNKFLSQIPINIKYKYDAYLYFKNNHYRPISLNNKFIFAKKII